MLLQYGPTLVGCTEHDINLLYNTEYGAPPSAALCGGIGRIYMTALRSSHDREPCKTANLPIGMPFGLATRVGPVNHVLDGSMGRGNFEGGGKALCKVGL